MSNAIDNIATLHFSPYILAPIFEAFYEQINPTPKNLLFSYLLLPLVLTPTSMNKLKNSNIRSTLLSFKKEKSVLFGLEESVRSLKETTNNCLLLLFQNESLSLKPNALIHFNKRVLEVNEGNSDAIRAGANLGKIFNKYDVSTCYRILGVKYI